MKFRAARKINLGNIDPILQYETEELEVADCDSMEEATQKLDLCVRERILHYRESVSAMKAAAAKTPPPVNPPPAASPTPAPAPAVTTPAAPVTTTPASPATPAAGGPPAEFNV